SPFADTAVMNSDAIAQAFEDAASDRDVRAIIFRVNSPGGSAVASDQILHAMQLAQQKGKKVVVSMGPYAASGGYYVAAGADSIIASPMTITGSIGIFGGKFVLGDALQRYLGARGDAIAVGSPYANMFTADAPFTNAQRQAFAAMIDRGYAAFLSVVASGRKMSMEQARAVAKGRVWTGAQAKERGLVDELGGLPAAVARAKALAGVKETTQVTLKLYPGEKSPLEQLQELLGVSAENARAAAALGAVLGDKRVNAILRDAVAGDQPALHARADVTVR
ncbi:MAG: signal peptide peptidase SppA, partial [Hyphomonadaceae bacterium]